MIIYRKGAPLRVRRVPAPQPPFWPATIIAPYGPRRAEPVSIDYLALRASAADRLEVGVADNITDQLSRERLLAEPVLIDAAESTETVFRRGEEALQFCAAQNRSVLYLVSAGGSLPSRAYDDATVVIAATRSDPAMFEEANALGLRWGVAVPVIFPLTTDLAALDDLVRGAHGARFFAAIPVEVEATARQAVAQSMGLDSDDDRYDLLFHADVAPIHLATERHIAALAAGHGMADFIVPPRWDERSNWNASVLLTRTASRMIAMELDLDLAGLIARSARAVAELDKPLERIAASASLSIIGGLDETSAEMLTEWLSSGSAGFAEYVDEQWRLPRGNTEHGTQNTER